MTAVMSRLSALNDSVAERANSPDVPTPPYRPDPARALLERLEPAPCDYCRLAERCRSKQLACRAFALFMAGASHIVWNEVNRAPTRERYEALLGGGI